MSETPEEIIAQTNITGWDGDAFTIGEENALTILMELDASGYVVLPKEPTEAMVKKGAVEMDPTWGYATQDVALDWSKNSYRAMRDAFKPTRYRLYRSV